VVVRIRLSGLEKGDAGPLSCAGFSRAGKGIARTRLDWDFRWWEPDEACASSCGRSGSKVFSAKKVSLREFFAAGATPTDDGRRLGVEQGTPHGVCGIRFTLPHRRCWQWEIVPRASRTPKITTYAQERIKERAERNSQSDPGTEAETGAPGSPRQEQVQGAFDAESSRWAK